MTEEKQEKSEAKDATNAVERDFSRVILTLENVLIPEDKISPSPSISDGLDAETEMDLRILGCELIQTAGILLKLPQVRTHFANCGMNETLVNLFSAK